MKMPSSFPVMYVDDLRLEDGYFVAATSFCRERLQRADPACRAHYAAARGDVARGFRMCPHGFTTLAVPLSDGPVVITGIVAAPRFDDSKERERAKTFPETRVSRESVGRTADGLLAMDIELQRLKEETRRKLPQALHELRKLNAIVKQSAERLTMREGGSDDAENVAGAAQLMSNIFEAVEVLTNMEDVSYAVSQKLEFVAVFDLAYKAKKIYSVRAKLRPIHIQVRGDDGVGILGSKKYFPIVLQVLLENAIKYGVKDSVIKLDISQIDGHCVLAVSNRADHEFDSLTCFDKGRRFADADIEGDGLGLYLAREIVSAHGGSIECAASGDVVTFTVRVKAHASRRGAW